MSIDKLSLQRIAHFLIIIALLIYFMIVAKAILIPMAFGVLFAYMLKPLSAFFEKRLPSRAGAILLTLLVIYLPLIGIVILLSWLSINIFQDLPSIQAQLEEGFQGLINWVRSNFGLTRREGEDLVKDYLSKILDNQASTIGSGLSTSTAIIGNILFTNIYIFLFLLYRSSIKKFFITQFYQDAKEAVKDILSNIQRIIQQYLYGMLLVMGVLAVLNTLGLWLIGVKYAYFWGILAAFLAIIPFIGTTLGGFLPFVFSLATGPWWQPIAVVALYFSIQQLEGNIITPKVVGSSVKVNPLAAIISLIIGGYVWGIAGLVLSLPIVAIFKIICDHIDTLKPLGLLLSSEVFDEEEEFEKKFDKDRFRLMRLFRRTPRN